MERYTRDGSKLHCICGREVDIVIPQSDPKKELISLHFDPAKAPRLGFCALGLLQTKLEEPNP